MLITISAGANANILAQVQQWLGENHFQARHGHFGQLPFLQIAGRHPELGQSLLGQFPQAIEVFNPSEAYEFADRKWLQTSTVIKAGDLQVGGNEINIAAGPCSVESEEQIFAAAERLSKLGVPFIRGGAYKPRTSPYKFQGLGLSGLKLLRAAADKYGLKVVTEVMDTTLIDEVAQYADIMQVGTRNMANYWFLRRLGEIKKPILLKRGMAATIEELLLAAEYVLMGGNAEVILCERGIRTFDPALRYTLDIGGIALLKKITHLPVWADPSHATGRRDLVGAAAFSAIAAGADGLILEVHADPDRALSDGNQSLYPSQLPPILQSIQALGTCTGRNLQLRYLPGQTLPAPAEGISQQKSPS